MSDTDLILIYKRFEEIDRELKQLRKEVGDMKWYAAPQTQQHGTTDAVAYNLNTHKVFIENSETTTDIPKPFIKLGDCLNESDGA